jgi:hypothetical protein
MLMDEEIIAIYCLCDDFIKGLGRYRDPQETMSDSEVMTTGLVSALYFGGNMEKARFLLDSPRYIPKMLSKSRLNRRLHAMMDKFLLFFNRLGYFWKESNKQSIYIIDSFPVSVCDNYRIKRAKIFQSESYRGYIASKRRYFYGVKIHLMVTEQGQPVEFFLSAGSFGDVQALKVFEFDLSEYSIVYGDKAFNDYQVEDNLLESGKIYLLPIRKKNSKRTLPGYIEYLQRLHRKIVETTGSLIERILPKHIQAVTAQGFELKVALFVIACSLSLLLSFV